MAFFVHSVEAGQAILSHELLARNIAYAPLETKGRVRVDLFFPHLAIGGQDNEALFEPLKDTIQQLSIAEAERRRRPGSSPIAADSEDAYRRVRFETEKREEQTIPPRSGALRSIVAFMFLGYVYQKAGTEILSEHLLLLRPYLVDDEITPFSAELSSIERTKFVDSAANRYGEFKAQLEWLREAGKRANLI